MILLSGILAGFCITFGATVYLMCLNAGAGEFGAKIVGAVMFCIGLFSIIHFNLWLYTGKIGYAIDNKPLYLLDCFVSFVGNAIGAIILPLFISLSTNGTKLQEQAAALVNAKLDSPWYSMFIMSIMCGMMIYLAVEGHKRCKYSVGKFLFAFMPIILFILCGFEHVVANVAYFTYARIFSWKALLYFALMFFGNGIGSIIFAGLLKIIEKLAPKKGEENAISDEEK